MVFTVIFGFLTIVGFSLFITILLSSILKAKSKKVLKKKELFNEIAYRSALEGRFRTEVEQQEREIRTTGAAETSGETSGGITSVGRITPKESKGMWAIPIGIILGTFILVFGVTMGGRIVHTFKSTPKIYFSEGINYVKMKPVRVSNRFTRGKVNVFIRFPEALATEKLLYEVYRIQEDGLSKYDELVIQRKPGKTVYMFKTVFDKTGIYLVYLRDYTTKAILKKTTIQIVPDEFAYKPVPGR